MILDRHPDIQRLSPSEKLVLVTELWDDLAAHPADIPVTPEQIAELDRRMEVYSKDPTQVTTWEAIRGGFPDPRMSDLEISEAPKARLIPAWGNAPGKPQTKPER
jgi:putative addiction module component (TIGR02574 family)